MTQSRSYALIRAADSGGRYPQALDQVQAGLDVLTQTHPTGLDRGELGGFRQTALTAPITRMEAELAHYLDRPPRKHSVRITRE